MERSIIQETSDPDNNQEHASRKADLAQIILSLGISNALLKSKNINLILSLISSNWVAVFNILRRFVEQTRHIRHRAVGAVNKVAS